jgi:iron complex outermembrane receptor protein
MNLPHQHQSINPASLRIRRTALAIALTSIAFAEQLHAAALEEVVVTARRASENLQDVPAAVTNFGGEALQDSGISDLSGIANITPSLVFAPSPGVGVNPQVAIRGQVQNDATVLTVDPAVGIYLDDVFLGRSPGSLLDMFDIARVEVLKGPQGTLYGRNTTGGALKVIPIKAEPGGDWNGFVRAMVGNYGQRHTEGAMNIPLTDTFAGRISYSQREMDGYGNATLVAADNPETIIGSFEPGAKATDTLRVNLMWDVTDSAVLEMGYDSSDTETNGAPSYDRAGDRARAPAALITSYERSSDDHYSYFTDVETKANALTDGLYFKGTYNFSWAELKAVVAQRNLDYAFTIDPDGTSARGVYTESQQDVKQTSYEIQLSGAIWEDRIQWIIGYFDFEEDGRDQTYTFASDVVAGAAVPGLPSAILLPSTGTAPLLNATGDADVLNTSDSAFAQVTWDALDNLSFTVGGRAINENKGLDITQFDSGLANDALGPNPTNDCIYANDPASGQSNGTDASSCYFRQDTDYKYNTWTYSGSWNVTDDMMVYAKKSRGVRSGGQNFRGRTAETLVPFNPEFVTDTEIGFKGEFFDSRVRLNLAGYHTDYKDIQFSDIVGISTFIQNLGDATIQGTEAELTVAATDTLTVIATGTLINFEYDDETLQGPFAPHKKASIALNYKQPLSWGEFGSNLSYAYSDKVPLDNDANAYENNPSVSQEAYGLLGFTAYINFESTGLRLGVFGNNLTDEETFGNVIPSFVFTDPLVGGVGTTGTPRMYGVDLTYRFFSL